MGSSVFHLDPAWIALIGTLCGGVGLKILEHWLGKSKVKIDEAARMREELRGEVNAQKEEIRLLEAEVDKWRQDYYDLRDEFSEAKTNYIIQLEQLKRQLEDAQKSIALSIDTEKVV